MNGTDLAVQKDSVITSLVRASTALAEARTAQETKKIVDVAAAAEIYAKRQQLGEESINIAHAIKIDALRKLGEILKATPKATAFLGGTNKEPTRNDAPTLAELGLDKKTSAVAQKLADLPQEAFEQVREGHETVARAIAAVKQIERKPTAPEPVIEPDPEPDLLADYEREVAENNRLRERIEAITKENLAAEVDKLVQKFSQLEGRLQHAITTGNEAAKQAQRQGKLLRQIREHLRVERDAEILPALKGGAK